jgi:hypothetical protein
MIFDCTSFVNVTGNTLLTRSSVLTPERMLKEVEALEAVHEEKVYVLRSFVNSDGDEIGTEIVTPAALACSEQLARVEFWRPKGRLPLCPQFTEGQQISKDDYKLAGVLITPEEKAVKLAYDYTEYPFQRWNPNLPDGESFSASVGDIFVMTSPANPEPVAFVAAGQGFLQVDFMA